MIIDPRVAPNDADALDRAIIWLIKQQSVTGAWASTTYGSMQQGAACTSLALYALSHLDPARAGKYGEAIELGFGFLKPGTVAETRVANPDGSLDYPVYSSAMYLRAAQALGYEIPKQLHNHLVEFLINSQCGPKRGFEKSTPDYGGWDILGPYTFPGKTSGTNISVTRFVLEAINNQTQAGVKPAIELARAWFEGLRQNSNDGGVRFSPSQKAALNKAPGDPKQPPSYGSPTADGVLVAHYLGADHQNESWIQLTGWLEQHPGVRSVPGLVASDDHSSWAEALHFYFLHSLAKTLRLIDADWAKTRSAAISKHLVSIQRPDGSFANSSSRMREDDPLIATSLAIIALASGKT